MGYHVNVDKPSGSATIHRVNDDPRCQPREKDEKDGYWVEHIPTREEALQVAENSGLRVHLCGVCKP